MIGVSIPLGLDLPVDKQKRVGKSREQGTALVQPVQKTLSNVIPGDIVDWVVIPYAVSGGGVASHYRLPLRLGGLGLPHVEIVADVDLVTGFLAGTV
jgi:hypothetical protein